MQLDVSNVQSNETLIVPSLSVRSFPQFPQLPFAVPRDLFDMQKVTHGFPFGWFVGQFFKYAMRPNPRFEQYIQERRREVGIQQPFIG